MEAKPGPGATEPLVSIVTPVLNRRETLSACLRAVEQQTYPRIEHVVVDGGSTDGTVELLQTQGERIRWISESDSGMYNAINKGLEMTTGEVVGYLNSDDLYLPYSVEAAVEALERGSDLIYGDLGVLSLDKQPTGFYPQFYRDFDLNYYTHFATLGQPTVFWTRQLLQRLGGFDETYRLLGDCEYWLRAAVQGARIKHLKEILAVQVEHAGTLRATNPDRLRSEFERLRTRYAPEAGPPRGARLEHPRRSFRWRIQQTAFVLSGALRRGKRWPRFLSYLRLSGVAVKPLGLLWYLLPVSIRPVNASLVDGPALERTLIRGAQDGSSQTL